MGDAPVMFGNSSSPAGIIWSVLSSSSAARFIVLALVVWGLKRIILWLVRSVSRSRRTFYRVVVACLLLGGSVRAQTPTPTPSGSPASVQTVRDEVGDSAFYAPDGAGGYQALLALILDRLQSIFAAICFLSGCVVWNTLSRRFRL